MNTSEARDVVQRLVTAMESQVTALRKEFGDKIDAFEKPTMVVMRSAEMAALKHCLDMMSRELLLDRLTTFAECHEGSDEAADALMRLLVGKCDHDFVREGRCELCGKAP